MAERLDRLHLANGLINNCSLLTPGLGLKLEHGICTLGNEVRHQQGYRRNANDHQGDLPVQDQHQYQGTHDCQKTRKQLGKAHK